MIEQLRQRYERAQGKKEQLESQKTRIESIIKQEKRNLFRYERASEIVKRVGIATQKQLEYHLSEQVSLALDAVFEDPYKLKVNFIEKRGKTEVELLFTKRDMEFVPIGNAGGGAIDVASFALRTAYWSMRQDKKVRNVLILDEPFSQLKGEYANQRALAVMQKLSKTLNLQIITVSDERVSQEDILANSDQIFLVSQNRKGESQIKKL